MPHHRTHLLVELALLPPLLAVGYALGWREELVPLAGGYLGGSLFLSPDLDLYHSRAARHWWVLRPLWRPYSCLFPHRGLSHHPILGPLSRLLYLALLSLLVGGLLGLPPLRIPSPSLWLPLLLGLFVPQLVHIFLDRW